MDPVAPSTSMPCSPPRGRRRASTTLAIRASWKKAQDALIAANTAEEEHAAELAQGPEAAIGDDPLAKVEGETHGSDADAGDYLNAEAADGDSAAE